MHLRYTPMNVFLQLLLISSQAMNAVKTAKEDFTLGLVYCEEIFEIKEYGVGITRENIERKLRYNPNSVFNTHFNLEVKTIKLSEKISPMEILNIYCQTILPMHFNAIIMPLTREGWKDPFATSYFAYFAGPLGIPVLTWDLDVFIPEKKLSNYIVKRYPYVAHFSSAMVSILQRFSWTDFSIVTSRNDYNHEFVQNIRAEVLKQGSKFKSKVNIQEVIQLNSKSSENDIRNNLVKLSATNTRVILLIHSKESKFKQIFKIAEQLGLTGKTYIWIVAQMNNQFQDVFSGHYATPIGSLGVTFYPLTLWKPYGIILNVALELLGDGIKQLIGSSKNISIGLLPNQSCNASEITRRENGENFLRYWTKLNFIPGMKLSVSENVLANTQAYEKNMTIINLKGGNMKRRETCGTWNPSELKLEEDIVWPGNSSTPPNGVPFRHMKVAFMEESPFIFLHSPNKTSGKCNNGSVVCNRGRQIIDPNRSNSSNSDVQNTDSCCSGYSIDLLIKFAKDLDFTYDLIRVKDGVWGAEKNGQWNGLVAALINHEADIAMTSFTINSMRKDVIDFSIPFLETRIAFLVAKKAGTISAMAFMEPFDNISWIMILLVSIHVVTSAIFMLEWFSLIGHNIKMETQRDNISVLKSYWLAWAILFDAAVRVDNPRSTSARFMTGIWALFALVFLGMYTANLTFFMTIPEVYISISGLKDDKLVNPDAYTTHLRYGTVFSGHTEAILKTYHPIVHNNLKEFHISTIEEGMIAVTNGELDAFIYDATVLKYHVDQDQRCLNFKIEGGNVITEYGIGFPKYSKFLSAFNNQLKIFKENGFLDSLQDKWMKATCNVETKQRTSSEPLSLLQFMGPFSLLGLGVILSIILLIIECLYARFYMDGSVRRNAKRKCGKIDLRRHLAKIFGGQYSQKRRNSEGSVFKIMRPELHRVSAINYEMGRIRYVWDCQDLK